MEFKSLPDIAGEKDKLAGLTWVGMEKIQMPIRIDEQILAAHVDARVNLKPATSRGIHMSRLYSLLSVGLSTQNLSWELLEKIAADFIESQNGISESAKITVKFELPLIRKALKSDSQGWRLYPVQMEVVKTPKGLLKNLGVEILYSSTCPASTALSKELWKQDLRRNFPEEADFSLEKVNEWISSQAGMPGTPHAQRSKADLRVSLVNPGDFGPEELIENLENILQTPVQTLVKRIDEQEFARINGQNTMFCEDAARKIQEWLEAQNFISGYRGVFEHQESLHPHNAVAVIEKISLF